MKYGLTISVNEWNSLPSGQVALYLKIYLLHFHLPTCGKRVSVLKFLRIDITIGCHKTPDSSGSDKIIYYTLNLVGILSQSKGNTLCYIGTSWNIFSC